MRPPAIKNRKKHIGPNLSLHYDQPLHLVKSKKQYLYDDNGNKFLDAIGNINIVGHCNKNVVNAIKKQSLLLNTNTRYLYNIMKEYSEKLLSYFPKKLSVIYFACSGSEANDLALRIAKNYTKGSEFFVIDNAYHGHTSSLIDLSPYKFNSRGGNGRKRYVHVLDMPDGIRGKYKNNEDNWIKKYIEDAKKKITKWLMDNGKGKATIHYKLRDWLFSRQRYWGEPIPVFHTDDGLVRDEPRRRGCFAAAARRRSYGRLQALFPELGARLGRRIALRMTVSSSLSRP